MNEARDHGVELVAPVVSPGEAGEVALGMIGAELAVGSGDRALDVAERRVDPFEGRHAGGLPPGAGADRAMASDDPVERVPAAQAVGEDLASGGQPALGAARDLALAEVDPSRKSGGALHHLHCFCLEFDGACEVQRRVPTDWIIEPIDVSGYGSFSLAS